MTWGGGRGTELLAKMVLSVSLVIASAATMWILLLSVRRTGDGASPEDQVVARWERFLPGGRRLGPDDAEVTIVVFGDYQCPYCRTAERTLREVRRRFPDDVAVVYKHFPLVGIHPYAYQAARVAECAGEQGAFHEAHEILFGLEDLEVLSGGSVPEDLSVAEAARLQECVADSLPVARVEQDLSDARELGVRRTPTFMVNGLLLGKNPTAEELLAMVKERVRE